MAETTSKKTSTRVTRRLERHGPNEEDMVVGINGVFTVIPRGQTVELPEEVAFEVDRALAAKEAQYATEAEIQNRLKEQAKNAGI